MSEIETTKVKGSIFTRKRIIVGVIGIIALFVSFYIGNLTAKVSLKDEKVSYDQLVSKIEDKKKTLEDTESKISSVESDYAKIEEEYNLALEVISNRDNASKELDEINTQLETKKGEITNLDEQIKSKNSELASVTGELEKAEGEPKTLIAGQHVVGTDVPEGRYQVTNIGRGTNFVVYDTSGYAVVNTILGNDIGSGDYVFFATEGQIIDTQGKVKLIPVQ